MFHVQKGKDNIWMVYDGTKLGLNDSLYAPWFSLPTVYAINRWVIASSWTTYNDYINMFLNILLQTALYNFLALIYLNSFQN